MAHEVDRMVLNGYSKLVEENIDMDSLLEATEVEIPDAEPESQLRVVDGVRVGVAMDEAFCFYYPENGVMAEFAYELLKGVGIESKKDGVFRENVLASYTHLHALGNENAFLRFLEAAR
jgi:cobyrinic acid a,c-diamide synthase